MHLSDLLEPHPRLALRLVQQQVPQGSDLRADAGCAGWMDRDVHRARALDDGAVVELVLRPSRESRVQPREEASAVRGNDPGRDPRAICQSAASPKVV